MSRLSRVAFVALVVSASSAPIALAQVKPVWPDEGPYKWPARPTVAAITANDLRSRLYPLSDDSMAGRRVGELGNYKGTAYIASEFKRMGLKPAGDSGGYFQNLSYGPAGFDSAASRLIAAGAPLAPRTDWVPVAPSTANGLSGKADLADAPTVFAGRWGDTIALDPASFKGKVAVFIAPPTAAGLMAPPRGTPVLPRCDSVPDKFGAAAAALVEAAQRADTAGGRGGRGGGGGRGGVGTGAPRDRRAETAGAVGILFVALDSATPTSVAGAFNRRGTMQSAVPTTGVLGAAAISNAVVMKLFGKPVDQLSPGVVGQPVSAHWSYDWRMSPTPARNVIAIVPGSDPARATQYVLISAHNDHVGTNATTVDHDSIRAVNTVIRRQGANDPACRPTAAQQQAIDSLIARARSIRPPRRDSIMNGADDDGSGTVALLEIAEQFAAEKPARSIIFVSHQGEEAGLLGSRWFTDHPTVPLDSIVAALNMDMEGKGRVEQVKFGGPASVQMLGARRLSREFGEIIDSVNATRAEVMAIDRSWDVTANPMNRFCRSDQVNYVRHNVPVVYVSTGYAQDYHQATDEPQYIDYDHMARVGRFVHDIALAVAQRRARPVIAGNDPAYPTCR